MVLKDEGHRKGADFLEGLLGFRVQVRSATNVRTQSSNLKAPQPPKSSNPINLRSLNPKQYTLKLKP